MTKSDFENKSLVLIVLISYMLNLLLGWTGFLCSPSSGAQVLIYQIGNAFAISASVMAARYTGLRGQHVAASAYILLGITHGISLAALTPTGINPDREITMAMPMIPALIFIFWCDLFPRWLRLTGIIPSIFFAMIYIHFHAGKPYFDWSLYAGYGTLQVMEVLWGIFLYKDWKMINATRQLP